MQAHEKITRALRAANDAGRTGLVPFITAGYPDPEKFIETLASIAAVSDVVELGVPFSDPMADGMTIQRSSFKAIENGVTLKWIFDSLQKSHAKIDAPLVMMSYLNPLLAYGLDRLAESSLKTGVCGFIVPDLPFEESEELRNALEAKGVGLIQLVTPATPETRLKKLAGASKGFLYAVTITGITGGGNGLPAGLAEYLDKVSGLSSLPVCAGFGIREAKDVANVGKHAAGAIVGSALVEVLERGEDAAAFLQSLRK
ncbi:MAG: tryptophan synthase subunit alpha [Gammaproteobacteria bacterium]|nr:tryptophan synthase subunit alpha [Gammaproteobacteria bacterium]MDH4314468.1 tryptophan synthase subunit alpha [Gammaproteobacteria bacterium]MDH5213209.1 tryptophan synthase subunit alpha [Gammaproteobacteria bacterium]MDH5501208.1 tryptophan synthase subunit alpha [Gammaproteobacteria bacterium]